MAEERKLPPAKPLTDEETAKLIEEFPRWDLTKILIIYRDTGGWCGFEDFYKFLYVCDKKNLDPFMNEVHGETRWSSEKGRHTLIPITHIDGARKVADSTQQYDGQDDPVFENNAKGELVSATVRVYRKDCAHPFGSTCFLNEFRGGGLWSSKPHVMLAKVAEMLSFRKGFPAALGGIYIEEEFDRNDMPAAAPPVEDFAVGQKTAETPPPAKAEAPPAKRETPPAPLPTQTVTMPSELETTTNKRMADIRHIIREVGKFDAPTTEKVLSMFLRNFFGVTTLPKDPESYQAPLAVLEALTPAGVEELIKDPTAAGKKAREPLEKAFDTWKWTVESCAIAKDFIRAKAMTYADFITWINMTGADKLSSEDVSAFLLLATCTSKAYMLLQLPNIKAITEAVTCLIDQFGGFAGLKAAKPDDVAAAIQGL